jgi:hypothetical protein
MNERDRRLRALLRDADPVVGAPELSPEDAARMRRSAMAAATERRPSGFAAPAWRVALAVAAAAALAVGLGLLLQRERSSVGAASPARDASLPRPQPPHEATVATAAAPRPSPEPPTHAEPLSPRTAAAAAPRARGDEPAPAVRRERPATRSEPATTVASATISSPAKPQPYQLQLTTPGGTRIVWVLEPGSSGR